PASTAGRSVRPGRIWNPSSAWGALPSPRRRARGRAPSRPARSPPRMPPGRPSTRPAPRPATPSPRPPPARLLQVLIDCGLSEPRTVQMWMDALGLLDGVAASLAVFDPAVFDAPVEE